MQTTRDERSLSDLFGELAGELGALVRQEAALAKAELSHKAGRLGRDAAVLAAGGFIAYAGFLVLLGAAVLLLAYVLPLWAAAALVGLVTVGIGYVLVQRGLAGLKDADLTPRRTVETLKQDVRVITEQAA